jgi:isopenicillin-N epimerase
MTAAGLSIDRTIAAMPSEHAHYWALQPGVAYLNHGGYGATPRVVLAAQQAWRDRMEAEPIAFFARDLEPALDAAREVVASFVGADADDLAFVTNATGGANAVLRSLHFRAGDELLTTDHAYNAIRNTLDFVAERSGARAVIAPVPFPIASPDEVTDAVLAAVTPRTRLAVLDHVTSPTALRFPVERLVAELSARGIETLVDGAHAAGMLTLEVANLGATYYVANLHKWACAPKGSGFLWVRRDRQELIHPLTISHGRNSPRHDRSRFRLEFDQTGTRDPSAWLASVDAIRFGEQLLPGGWPALAARNRELALAARDLMCHALQIRPWAPDKMIGSMVAVPLPPVGDPADTPSLEPYGDPVHDALIEQAFEVMINAWPPRPDGRPWRRLLRVSAAVYNDLDQYRRLAELLPGVLAVTQGRGATPSGVRPA